MITGESPGSRPQPGASSLPSLLRVSRYFALFAALWIVAVSAKLYPQFKDSLRIEGQVITLDDYISQTCGERAGTLAASCRAQAVETGARLVARQQAKSLLLIQAPIIFYVVIYLPFALIARRFSRRRKSSP